MIYFDNAATTLMKPPAVADAVAHAITSFGGVGRGVHEASLIAGMAVHEAREKIARFFGVSAAHNVVFSPNATEAINVVVSGLLDVGDHVITTAASHNSVLRPLYRMQDSGCALTVVPIAHDGTLDYAELEAAFRPDTKLVIVTHASNLTGDVYDIERIARMCRARNVLFAVDAAQTAGHIDITMEGQGLDILVFTGHKSLFGPQGTGGLCLAEGVAIRPLMVGGTGTHSYDREHPSCMPERLEAGTLNSHGIAGLSAGLDYIEHRGIQEIAAVTKGLSDRFIAGISAIGSIKVYGRRDGSDHCGIVALNVGETDPAIVSDILSTDYGICTRAGSHCAPLMHVSLGTQHQGAVRFGFSVFNTEDEIDTGIDALAEMAWALGAERR